MEKKKSISADLERFKIYFFQAGAIIALSVSLIAFEWRNYNVVVFEDECAWLPIAMEDPIDITYRKSKPLPPPLKKNVDVILIGKVDLPSPVPIVKPAVIDPTGPIESIEEPDELGEMLPFILVENKPIYPGCEGLDKQESFECFQNSLLRDVLKVVDYPKEAREMGVEGTVYVSFVVNKEGLVDDVSVARGVDRYLDEEAIRAVKTIPQMTPAKQRDRPVAIMYSVPVSFKINK